jgi:hypothetical protein
VVPDSLPYGERRRAARVGIPVRKKLLVATVVGVLALAAPLPAHADGAGYRGTCRISAVNDTTGALGGPNVWTGPVSVLVVANAPGDSIRATCSIKVNSVNQGVVLDTGNNIGVAADAGRATYTAAVTDVVEICTNVTTGTLGYESSCVDLISTPVCPEQVCGDGGVLDQVAAVARSVDPTLCALLVSIAPVVDGVFNPNFLYIDPVTGDTYAGGTTPAQRIQDCPPYESDPYVPLDTPWIHH